MVDTSKSNVQKSIFQNSLAIFSGRLLTIFFSFLVIPVVIEKIGIEAYGTWESILAVVAIVNVLQAVISGTTLWLVSNANGKRNVLEVGEYFRLGLFFLICLILTALPTMLVWRESIVEYFKIPESLRQTAFWVLPSVVLLSFFLGVNELFAAVVGGMQRSGSVAMTQAITALAGSTVTIFSLHLGLGFGSLFLGMGVSAVAATLRLYAIAKKLCPSLSLTPKVPNVEFFQKIAPYAGFMLLGAVSAALRDQTDKIVLASSASSIWAGYYGIASRLAGIVMIVCTFFYVPTIAAAGALYARDDRVGIDAIYRDVSSFVSWVVGLSIVLLGCLFDRLMVFWIGYSIPEVGPIFYLLLLGNGFAVMLTSVGTSVCKGMGVVKVETRYIVAGLVLNVALKFALVPIIGGIGGVAATAISWSLASALFVFLLHKFTAIPWQGSIKLIKTLGLIVIFVYFGRILSRYIPIGQSRTEVALFATAIGIGLSITFSASLVFSKVLPYSMFRVGLLRVRSKLSGGSKI